MVKKNEAANTPKEEGNQTRSCPWAPKRKEPVSRRTGNMRPRVLFPPNENQRIYTTRQLLILYYLLVLDVRKRMEKLSLE